MLYLEKFSSSLPLESPLSVIKRDFMNFNYTFPEKNRLYWEMIKSFAYEGMKRIGVKER